MHTKQVVFAGKKLGSASRALIMLHGRGATAADILSLAPHLHTEDFAIVAPQAAQHTWYPQSFLAPPAQNEPWLTTALHVLEEVVMDIRQAGIATRDIYFAGFSQGACLTLEFVARHAQRWGGAAAFTGGLIGDKLYPEKYRGDFDGTPVFIGTGDPDPHVPAERVLASGTLLQRMNASVTVEVYPSIGHTIVQEEIAAANRLIFAQSA